eukprot:4252884-Prymnesium_polylepis.1
MATAPRPPGNESLTDNQTNGSNVTYEEVNDTNYTAVWEAFLKTLPAQEPAYDQQIASAVMRPRTGEILWSTDYGHFMRGRLHVTEEAISVRDPVVMAVGNFTTKTARFSIDSHGDIGLLFFVDADGVHRAVLDQTAGA